MAGRIILCLSCLMCAGAFFLLSYLTRIRTSPVQFWTGSEERLNKIVKDVPGYNRKMGNTFRLYSAAWLLCGILGAFFPVAGILGLALLCTLGLFLLYRRYCCILEEYT